MDGLIAKMNKIILTFGYKSLSAQCRESTKFDIVPLSSLYHFTHHRSYSDCKPCVDGKSGKASADHWTMLQDFSTYGTNLEANSMSLCLGLKRSSPWIIFSLLCFLFDIFNDNDFCEVN